MANIDGEYIPIQLSIYRVKIVDSNNSPISGATVEFSHRSNTYTTGDDGIVGPVSGRVFRVACTVSKTGYEVWSDLILPVDDLNDYTTITLLSSPNTYYCYIKVVDSSDNSILIGADVRVFNKNDNTSTATPIVTLVTDSTGVAKYVYTDNSGQSPSEYKFKISKNGYVSQEVNHTVSSSEQAAEQNKKTVSLSLSQASITEYFYVLYVKDNEGNPVSNISVNFYKNITYTTQFKQFKCNHCGYVYGGDVAPINCPICNQSGFNEISTMVTNENGLICISLGELASNPLVDIYARCVSVPDEYETEGQTLQCVVHPGTDKYVPGGTIELVPKIPLYYNFIVRDLYTNMPVENATVLYKKNNETVLSRNTDSSGMTTVFSSISYQYLDISVNKDGYEVCNIKECPGNETNEYDLIKLKPNNSIRVKNSADEGVGLDGLEVKIICKDSSGDREIGDYPVVKGYQDNYYVQTLPASVYTSGNRYLVSLNGDTYKNVYKVYITSGETTIDIANRTDSGETVDTEEMLDVFNEMSVKSIKDHIDSGENDEVSYHNTKKDNNNRDAKDYRIKIINPDSINVYDIFASTPIEMSNDHKNIIASMDICLKENIDELRVKTINRYSGYYNPIFKDVLFYDNMPVKVTVDGVEKNIECPFSNTSFDYDYNDNYGMFGIINNMWFHKVNSKNTEIINTTEPYYPLTGQYALDSRDYNIFETNWDMGHYTEQVDIENSRLCQNISSMKDGLCMFGSKYLNVPDIIEIYGITLGDDPEWKGEWNEEWITQPEVCPGEIMFEEINDNSVNFYIFLKKRIIRFFQEKLKNEFSKYIADDFSFGKVGLDDDIEEYVKKNILNLYELENIRLFVRRTKKGVHNSKIENDYTTYLEYDRNENEQSYFQTHNLIEYFKQHGFIEVNNIRLTKVNTDDFDRKVVYNLKNGYKEEFGFSFVLKKI